jgi:hypothetical protein
MESRRGRSGELGIVPQPLNRVTENLEGIFDLLPTLSSLGSIASLTDEALMGDADFLVGRLRGKT